MKTISQVAQRLGPGSVIRVAGAWSAVVAVSAAALLVSGVGAWADSVAEKSVLVIPALMPKSGVVPVPPENDIRLAYKNTFEPFWTETSYGRFQVKTKVVGYGNMPWSKVARPGATVGQGASGNAEKFKEGKANMPYNNMLDNSIPIIDGFWTPGERFRDNNGDGVYTRADPWTDVIYPANTLNAVGKVDGMWDLHGERFADLDGNGKYSGPVLIFVYDAAEDDGGGPTGLVGPDAGGIMGDGILGDPHLAASRPAVKKITIDELFPGPLFGSQLAALQPTDPASLIPPYSLSTFTGDFQTRKYNAYGVPTQPVQAPNLVFDYGPTAALPQYADTGLTMSYWTVTTASYNVGGGLWSATVKQVDVKIFETVEPYTDADQDGAWTNREPFEDYLVRWTPTGWVMVTDQYMIDNYPGNGVDFLDSRRHRTPFAIPDLTVGIQTPLALWYNDANGNGQYDPGEDIWIDDGGTPGKFDAGGPAPAPAPDTKVYDGDDGWTTADGTVGIQTGLFFVDNSPANGLYDTGEYIFSDTLASTDVYNNGVDIKVYDGGTPWTTADGTIGVQTRLYYDGQYAVGPGYPAGGRIWLDMPGGTAGVYDSGIDINVFGGVIANGAVGRQTGLYYHDANDNGRWDAGEDIWADPADGGRDIYNDGVDVKRYDGGSGSWTTLDGTVGTNSHFYYRDADNSGDYTAGEDIWTGTSAIYDPLYDSKVNHTASGWTTPKGAPGIQKGLFYNDVNGDGSWGNYGFEDIWSDTPSLMVEAVYDVGVDTLVYAPGASSGPNGIDDNIDMLMDRTGNGVYDGPEAFDDFGDRHMQRMGTLLTPTSTIQYWDPHGDYAPLSAATNLTRYGVNQAGGNSFNQWWIATFRSASPGYPGSIPDMQVFDPVPIRPFAQPIGPFVPALGQTKDSGTGPIYSDVTGKYYDSWREYRDLPSSIYHIGGDNRLGEETDPKSFSIYGTDKGTGSPMRVFVDGTITAAGPMAWDIHGDFGYDAGDLLTLETLTWRTNATSLTDHAYNAESLLGANNTGRRADGWIGIDSADRRCRDNNLDGMIDQGASPDIGFCNYIGDTNPVTPDNGSMTVYPYNRERFTEDLMEFTDNIEDFELYSDDGSFIDYVVGIYPDGYPGADFQGLSGFGWSVMTLDRVTEISYGGQVTNMSGSEGGSGGGGGFGMGLVAHEATHDWLGAPDLYDYDSFNGIIINNPIGRFDLMAGGGLVHYTGPLKASFGWTTPIDLKRVLHSGQIENLDLYPIETNINQYYVYYREGGAEQFWFWYEDGLGQFSKGLGNGLIIEHAELGTNPDGHPEQQRHNDHFTWEIVPADGLFQMQDGGNAGDAGDIWPGTSGNTTWTADTNPSSRWWDLVESGIEILNIVLPANPMDPINVTFRWIDRPVPSLSFVNPPGGTTVGVLYNLVYAAWDFWGGTRIYLYRDTDNSGNDGVLIGGPLTKLPGDTVDLFKTAINALPDGNYYFYALLVPGTALDENNTPQTESAYSSPIPALANVGNGTLTVGSVTINPAGLMSANSSLQIWTVICTAVAVGPTPAKFSVRGSVTGIEALSASANVAFTPAKPFTGITFTVHTGSTPFAVGDGFTFRTTGITPYSAPLYVVGGATPGLNKYPGDQPKFADSDKDRLPDWWEYMIFGNLTTASGVAGAETNHDTDHLNDLYEYWAGTNPLFWDSNSDGISDDYDDPDGDGLTNYEEQLLGTRPDLWDTDDDGLGDGTELAAGTDPLDGFNPFQERSILLDGAASSYVTMPVQKRFAMGASFTIEAKVKPAAGFNQAATVIQRVVGMYYGKPEVNYGIRLSATGQPEAFYTNGAGTEHKVAASTSIPFGTWTSLAMTYDATGKKLSLYINGMLANSINTYLIPVMESNAQPFTRSGESLKGSVDELRFWNIALPGATILSNLARTLVGNEAGLVAYYRFDDGGQTAQDAMLTSAQDWNNDWGNAATLNGSAAFDPPTIDDSDGDGLPDWWEILYFGDLSQDGTGNPDCDPLNNLQEYLAGTDPTNPDSNGDGIKDGWQWLLAVPQPWIGITPSAAGLVARDALLQANTNVVPAIDPLLGVALTYTYKWTKGADPTALSTTNTLDLAPLGLSAGVVINLEVKAYAPNSCIPLSPFISPTATVSVTTSNALALVRPVPLSFLPLAPTPADALVVQVRNPNAASVTLALNWYRNHAFVKTMTKVTSAGATSTFTLDEPLVAGDIWYFTVYAYDGIGGVSAVYNSLTEPGGLGSRLVVNSASSSGAAADTGVTGQLTATVTPALPFIDDILLCSASGASAGAGIPFGYFFSWYIFDQTTAAYVPLNQVGPTLDLATVGDPQTITDGTTVGGVSTGGTWLTWAGRPDEYIVTGATINNPVVDQTTGVITGGTIILGSNRGAGLAGSTTVGGVTVGTGPAGTPITIYGGTTTLGDTLYGTIMAGTITSGLIYPIPPVGTMTVTGATLARGPDLNGVTHEVLLTGVTLQGGTTVGGITDGSAVPGLAVGGRIYCQVYAMDAYGKRSETVASNVVTIQRNPSSSTAPDGKGWYEPNDTPAQARRIIPKLNPLAIADPNVQLQATINGDLDWYWFVVPDTWGNRSSRVVFETNNGITMYTSSHSSTMDFHDTQLKLYDKGMKQLLFVDDLGTVGGPGSTKYARFDTMLKPGLYYVMVTTVEQVAFTYSAHLVVEPGAGALPPTAPTTVTLAPAAPGDNDDLVCTATGATSGLGAGAIVYRYTWFRDGQVMPFGTSQTLNWLAFGFEFAQSTTDNTLNHVYTLPGESWTCLVYATDANGISEPVVSNSVVIAGTPAPPPSAGWDMVISSRTILIGSPIPVDSSVGIGWLAGATNGFDENIDQQLLVAPPAPGSGTTLPAGTLYSIGLQTAYPALSVDVRPPGTAISWDLRLDLGKLGQSATLSWDNLAVPSGDVPLTLTEVDPATFLPIPGTTIDMSAINQLVVPNVGGATSKIYRVAFGGGDGAQTLKLNFGWNLVSFAVQPTGGQADMEQAFIVNGTSVKLGPVWSLQNGAYIAATTIETKKAYWVYSPLAAGATVTVYGTPGTGDVPLVLGWNMVGFLADKAKPVAAFIDAFYGFAGAAGYSTPGSVKKGNGYWIHTTAAGIIPAL